MSGSAGVAGRSYGVSAVAEFELGVMLTVNHRSGATGRKNAPTAFMICAAIGAAWLPLGARAQFTGKASAIGQFESNSNVFALESGVAPPENGDSRRSDTFLAYGAEFNGLYSTGRQEFYATASTKEYDYHHFTELDHNDYKLDAGLNWKLGGPLSGTLDMTRNHTMVPLYDLTGTQLALSVVTEQKESARVDLKLNSNWMVEGSGFTSKSEQPLVGAPDLQLTQSSGTASLEYLGVGGFTSGITAGYLTGDYSGANATANPSYSQTTAGFLAKYKRYRTTFDGQIGYSKRDSSDGSDNTSGITGLLAFTDQLTPKTSFSVKADRTINSYFLNTGSEIDTEAGASVVWQALYKLGVTVGYTFTYRKYPGQGNNPVGSDRVDIQEYATLGINYEPQRWLLIRPYANVETRRSTFIGGHFSATIFGVFLTVTPYQSKK